MKLVVLSQVVLTDVVFAVQLQLHINKDIALLFHQLIPSFWLGGC